MDMLTIRELFVYNDWARDRLMALVEPLDAVKLDRPFEMGEGSLRKTMQHLFGAEWRWLRRWQGQGPTIPETPHDFPTMTALWKEWRATAADRDAFLSTLTQADPQRSVTYNNHLGKPCSFQLGHMLLHVCNHGTHHRAQVMNMLRHVGVPPPEMDFLDMCAG